MPLFLLTFLKSGYTYLALLVLGAILYVGVLHHEVSSLKSQVSVDKLSIASLREANTTDLGTISTLKSANAAWAKLAADNEQKAIGLQVAIDALDESYKVRITKLQEAQKADDHAAPLLDQSLDACCAPLVKRLRDEAASVAN